MNNSEKKTTTPKTATNSRSKSSNSLTKHKAAVGMGVAAVAAAAAGAYFLYGTEAGKKKRKDIKSWTLKMKADVMDKMENMKDWSETSYQDMIDSVAAKYKNLKSIDPDEFRAAVEDMKKHWKNIRKHIEGEEAKKKAK